MHDAPHAEAIAAASATRQRVESKPSAGKGIHKPRATTLTASRTLLPFVWEPGSCRQRPCASTGCGTKQLGEACCAQCSPQAARHLVPAQVARFSWTAHAGRSARSHNYGKAVSPTQRRSLTVGKRLLAREPPERQPQSSIRLASATSAPVAPCRWRRPSRTTCRCSSPARCKRSRVSRSCRRAAAARPPTCSSTRCRLGPITTTTSRPSIFSRRCHLAVTHSRASPARLQGCSGRGW